jgi:hypothetical protein
MNSMGRLGTPDMTNEHSLADSPPGEDQDWRAKLAREADSNDIAADLARAREPGRGRQAEHPTEFPSRGWFDILWRVVLSIPQDRVLATAGSVAFFALLAIFPALAVVVSTTSRSWPASCPAARSTSSATKSSRS